MVLNDILQYDIVDNGIESIDEHAMQALVNLINYEFAEVKSYDELDKNEKELITEDQFNYLFTNN